MNARVAILVSCLWAMSFSGQAANADSVKDSASESAPPFKLDQKKITASLRLPKNQIMLGEPIHFEFVVKNASEQTLWVLQGGDYRNASGRPESFKVTVVDAEGRKVPQPDSGPQFGGIISFVKLPAGGEKVFDLFLPHWATFERPGRYAIKVERTLVLNTRNSMDDVSYGPDKKGRTLDLPASASAELEVVPLDQEKLGKIIDGLGERIVAQPPNHSTPPVDWVIRELSAIHDERTIPWFLKMLGKSDYEMKFYAVRALGKYDNRDAFGGLKKGLATTEADCSSSANIVHTAAGSLAGSPYSEALPFLLTQFRHSNDQVRLTVTHALGHKVSKAEAVPLLETMVQDKNEIVSSEAKRYLREIRESEASGKGAGRP